jgi:hypothetical protein
LIQAKHRSYFQGFLDAQGLAPGAAGKSKKRGGPGGDLLAKIHQDRATGNL